MKRLLIIVAALFFSSAAYAQGTPVVTQPKGVTTGQVNNGTITVTDTFQSVIAASTTTTGRLSCALQNQGTHVMYVFFGPIADATKAKSIQLQAGQAVNCNVGNVVLKDQVSVTGTSGDAYWAAQQ